MNIDMESSYTCLTDPVEIFENFVWCRLPRGYRSFLKETNGGVPKKKFFNYKNSENGSIISSMFGITKDYNDNIIKMYNGYKGIIDDNMIPIGIDQGGNVLLLAVRGQSYGKIYFLDHEKPIVLIADSFEEFINSLKSEEEMEELEKAQQ